MSGVIIGVLYQNLSVTGLGPELGKETPQYLLYCEVTAQVGILAIEPYVST